MKKIGQLVKEYYRLENQIKNKLDKMRNAGMRCDCDDCETITFIHAGNYKEMMVFCVNCGGYMEGDC